MRKSWIVFWSDDIVRRSIKLFLVIESIFLLFFGFIFNKLPLQLPLFYSLPRSNEQLATPLVFMILPIFSLFIMIMNLVIGFILFKSYLLLSRIIVMSGTIFVFMLFVTFLKIIAAVS